MTKITLLGTSCMVPTKERNVPSVAVEYNGECLLFDCGEGTQRQMNITGINRNSVTRIFISHWHADHVAGIIGLLQTIDDRHGEKQIHIYGPQETKVRMQHLLDATIHENHLDIHIYEIEETKNVVTICQTEGYTIEAISLEHATPVLGFTFIENERRRVDMKKAASLGLEEGPVIAKLQRGESVMIGKREVLADEVTFMVPSKKLTYIADTAFCPQAVTLAENSDLVVSESTFALSHEENAHKTKHLTSTQAAQIAAMSNSERLVLFHISQRYKDIADLVEEAKTVFPNTELGFDFMSFGL